MELLRARLVSTDRVFRSATVQAARSRDEGLSALFRTASDATDWAVPPERRAEGLIKYALSRIFRIGCSIVVIFVLLGCSQKVSDPVTVTGPAEAGQPVIVPNTTFDSSTSTEQNPILESGTQPIVVIDSGTNTTPSPDDRSQLDIIIMVDNSISMEEEQRILATQFFNLVNALVDPPVEPECGVFENVRIGVITSDMGLQAGTDQQVPSFAFDQCQGFGDNAVFMTYGTGHAIDIQPNAIRCDEDASQCPIGWNCESIDTNGVGTCSPPGGGSGLSQACPALNGLWLETKASEKNQNLAFQTSCLAKQGTTGCGLEQQLKSIGVASLVNGGFLRENALLAVIIVSDEEDCSIDKLAFFDAPEFRTDEINLACGRHPDNLDAITSYRDRLLALKGGDANKVIFAAIVGVPLGSDCEGRGDAISNCLNHPDMQLREVDEMSSSGANFWWVYAPACERYSPANSTAEEDKVTEARPGRRYVELAQQFGSMGYVSSICNEDWEAVMKEIAKLITCIV